jgi:hypothetical protein
MGAARPGRNPERYLPKPEKSGVESGPVDAKKTPEAVRRLDEDE